MCVSQVCTCLFLLEFPSFFFLNRLLICKMSSVWGFVIVLKYICVQLVMLSLSLVCVWVRVCGWAYIVCVCVCTQVDILVWICAGAHTLTQDMPAVLSLLSLSLPPSLSRFVPFLVQPHPSSSQFSILFDYKHSLFQWIWASGIGDFSLEVYMGSDSIP